MNKDELLRSQWAYMANPQDLESFEETCIWLEAMLSGPCGIWEENGETQVINQRVLVERVKGMELIINPKEHAPPHFHVRYGGNDVGLAIADCSLVSGSIGHREYAIVRHWHKHSRAKLELKWNETRPTHCPVGVIQQ